MLKIAKIGLALILIIFWAPAARCQNPLEIHGLVDVVAKNTSAKDFANTTTFGNSNFHSLRIRLFLEKKVSDNVEVFAQLLTDNARPPRIYGAYVRLKSGNSWLNGEAGLIRNPFGTWGPRTYSDKNPLIGVPFGYNYHTAVTEFVIQQNVTQLFATRGRGNNPAPPNNFSPGLPFVYDACWNTGLLLFGGNGKIDYMAAVLSGSLTIPTTERRRGYPQFSGRLGYSPLMGLNIGSSFAYGPYLNNDYKSQLPAGADMDKFYQRLIGWDLNFERGKFVGNAEAMANRWTHPYIPGPLDAYTWYLEGTYKFATRFFFAARYDRMEFSKITDPNGGQSVWDFPLYRVESGIGYKIDRNVTFKVVGQWTRYPGQRQFNDEIWATQLSASL